MVYDWCRMSGKLENLRRLLRQGYTPTDLVAQGYPKTSVYKAANQLRRGGRVRPSGIRARAEGTLVDDRSYIVGVEPSLGIEPQAATELKAKLDEVIWWIKQIKQECERLRIEMEAARRASVAEEQARREQEKALYNARRRRLFNKLIEAQEAGRIDTYQFTAIFSGLDTLEDIRSSENALRLLAGKHSED